MKLRFVLALLLTAASGAANAQVFSDKPYIAERGHAEVAVVPDTFPVSVWIVEIDMDRDKAQSSVEILAKEMVASAKKIGVRDSEMSVGNLRVSSEFESDDQGKSSFVGTRYERSFQFRFHRLRDLKAFLSALPPRKQVQSQVGDFSISQERELKRALVSDAAKDAKSTGDAYAGSVGKRLGSVLAISDKPLTQIAGGYINPIDVSSVESTTILTAEQVAKLPSGGQMMHLLAQGRRSETVEIVLSEGVAKISADAYVVYSLVD